MANGTVPLPFADTAPAADGAGADAGERDGRRRRRRGGRDRGEGRGDEAVVRTDEAAADAAPVAAEGAGSPAAPGTEGGEAVAEGGERERGRRRGRGRDRNRDERPEGASPDEASDAPATMPTVAQYEEAPAASAWAAQEAIAAPAPVFEAPVHTTRVAAPAPPVSSVPTEPVRIEPYLLPTDTLQSLAAGAGLEWVNSDAEKIRAVQAAMAAEPAPARVPREPRRHVLVDDGPLVLVETRKDLSQLKLPFEQQQPGA
jgi:ribonuclease E